MAIPQHMEETMARVMEQMTLFRKDYDKLMDAVQFFSVCIGTDAEAMAIERMKEVYTNNQETWGG